MLFYEIVSAVCLGIMLAECAAVAIYLLLRPHSERIQFLRGFKKGKCIIIYVTAIPLYFLGYLYQSQNILTSFFTCIPNVLDLVVLKYNTAPLNALMGNSPLYTLAVYLCYTMVALNAVLFSLSLLGQYLWDWYRRIRFSLSRKEKLILFGNNPDTLCIYRSDKSRRKLVFDNISPEDQAQLYIQKIAYLSIQEDAAGLARIQTLLKKSRHPLTLIIHTKDDSRNMALCSSLLQLLEPLSQQDQADIFLRLRIFVFGDPRYEAIYENMVSRSGGILRYVNKYQQIAMDFIDKYPLTRFMNESQIDYSTSLVKEDVDINLLLIGFGKANQQIFLTSVANNQFITEKNHRISIKQVNYHIFDRKKADNNKNLNHSYYRFAHECQHLSAEDYLPLPEAPAQEFYHTLNVNDHAFYRDIQQIVTRSPADCNAIVISYGTDLENLDMAQKLAQKRQEWGVPALPIFVKVRELCNTRALPAQANCFFIGCEKEEIFQIEHILHDPITAMAQRRNMLHALEKFVRTNKLQSEESITRDWYRQSHLKRDSSLYCCLSLRSKLHMMGLDYVPADAAGTALTEQAYLQQYAGADMPDYSDGRRCSNGMPLVRYQLPFKASRRADMATHEHYRWNAYMLSRGFIPATVTQIRQERSADGAYTNGTDYSLRRHGNLTTMQGLEQFRDICVQRDGSKPIDADVIKYDYQILDEAWWLLKDAGCKIIRKP